MKLSNRFDMEDPGERTFAAECPSSGIEAMACSPLTNMHTSEQSWKKFGMEDCKPVATLEVENKFQKLSEDEEPLNLREVNISQQSDP